MTHHSSSEQQARAEQNDQCGSKGNGARRQGAHPQRCQTQMASTRAAYRSLFPEPHVAESRPAADQEVTSGSGELATLCWSQIRLLRSMLEWRQEDISSSKAERESVIVLVWPQGSFLLLPKGTTAGGRGALIVVQALVK